MNETKKVIFSDFSKAADLDNFRIMSDGSLKKRDGYTKLHTFDAKLRGAITVRNGTNETIYAVAGKKLYEITDTNGFTVKLIGTLTNMNFTTTNDKVDMFMFNRTLYILGGGNYYKLSGSTLSLVEGYAPLIRRYASATNHGTEYERPNLLTNQVRMRFIPDGSSRQFKLYGAAASLQAIYVSGKQTTGYIYTVDTDVYAVLPSVVPANIEDVIEIRYTLSGDTRRSELTSCHHHEIYGSDSDSRVFLYGGNFPSVMFPSSPENGDTYQAISAEYFPVGTEITVGDGNENVNGVVRQTDCLTIFTEGSAYYTYPQEEAPFQGIPRYSFPILPLSTDIGAYNSGGAVFVDIELFALNQMGLFRVKFMPVEDERVIVHEQAPDYVGLTREFIENCSLYVNQLANEIWCCGQGAYLGKIVIYNAKLGRWYRFSGISPSFIFTYYSEPAFAVGTGLYHFSSNYLTDNGTPFNASYKSDLLTLTNPFDTKHIYEFGISMERVQGATYHCILASDNADDHLVEFTVPTSAPLTDKPIVLRSHARLNHVSYLTYQIVLDPNTPPAKIYGAMLRYRSF